MAVVLCNRRPIYKKHERELFSMSYMENDKEINRFFFQNERKGEPLNIGCLSQVCNLQREFSIS